MQIGLLIHGDSIGAGATYERRNRNNELPAPVAAAAVVQNAVRLANENEYRLSMAVFGQDISRAMRVAGQISSRICHINGPTAQNEAQVPFGDMGASGYGRFGGRASIAEFTDLRWITVNAESQHHLF